MSESFLRVVGVSALHPGTSVEALRDVTFSMDRGEVVALLGSSGAGKSSLLRALSGLLPVAGGRIVLDGRDITTQPAHLREVGLMFQDHALFPHLSVVDNVAFGLKMAGEPRAHRRALASEMLDLVGLSGFESRRVASLSGGEKQRVALARTLAPSPRLVLLDEPFGSLDRVLRDQLVSELGALNSRLGSTVIVVTHDRSEALALGDRLGVIEDGALLQLGTPQQVQNEPASDHVSRLLGLGGAPPVDHT